MPRPVAVTIVAWLLIVDAPVTLLFLLFALRFPEVTVETPLPPWRLALGAAQALAAGAGSLARANRLNQA
jgi:hypothetical protein